MALHMGMKCVKYLLFVFNLIFVIAGVSLIIVGSVVEHFFRNYFNFIESKSVISVSAIVITVGSVIFIVGFFGCCGAMKEDRCMIATFSVLVSVIFIVELGASIAAYVMRNELQKSIKREVQLSMKKYNDDHHGIMRTWNVVQHDYRCCGTVGYKDWKNTQFGDVRSGVPDTCCKQSTFSCGERVFEDDRKLNDIYKRGCFNQLKGDFANNMTILAGVAIGISFIELLGVLFACCLVWSIRHQYQAV